MSQYIKAGGIWRAAKPYVKVGGIWKFPDYIYHKVADRWYTSFVKGGLVDRSWDDRDKTGEFEVGGNDAVLQTVPQPDGKILVGGAFSIWNSATAGGIVRLNADGTQDVAFTANTGTGADDTVNSIAVQTDGKILVGGEFSSWDGSSVGYIVRLNSDGTRDTTFSTNIGTAAHDYIKSIAVQSDGKILVGGAFIIWNGVSHRRIVRLNSDGTRDTTFTTNIGTAANSVIFSIVIQSDGKILLCGNFTAWSGTSVGRILRLNSDGTRDAIFAANTDIGADSQIDLTAVQSDGKIIIGGSFTTWNGLIVNRIVRLNSDGTTDFTFQANTDNGASAAIRSIAVQSDGKIILVGDFTTWNGTALNYIVRLNSDGTTDTAFTANLGAGPNSGVRHVRVQSDGTILVGGNFTAWNNALSPRYIKKLNSDGSSTFAVSFANATVSSIAIQTDGKIILGGLFTTWNAVTVGCIVRLNADGTQDTAFTTNTGTGATSHVLTIAVQTDGKILVGGEIYTWDDSSVGYIVRLNADGTIDTTFATNTGTAAANNVNSIVVQPDGKILVGGAFSSWNGSSVGRIVRLNSDGTRDTAFTTNTGTGADNTVHSIVVQPDGKILVGGRFTTWNAVTVGYIVRLNPDGTRDTAFTTANGTGASSWVRTIAVQNDGKIVLGGHFSTWNGSTVNYIVRLDSTGTRDTAFTTNAGAAANSAIFVIVIQPDGKILVGGSFFSFKVGNQFRRFFVRIGGEDAS